MIEEAIKKLGDNFVRLEKNAFWSIEFKTRYGTKTYGGKLEEILNDALFYIEHQHDR